MARRGYPPRKRKPATKRARSNPAPRRNHHLQGAVLLAEHVTSVAYMQHRQTRYKGEYVHKFPKSKGIVKLYALRDGTLLLKGKVPLYDEYIVPDDE
jgi:hypothetical protein